MVIIKKNVIYLGSLEGKMMKKKVFCLGATGFIGSHLVSSLLKNNYDVILFSRNPEKTKALWPEVKVISSYDQIDADQEIYGCINLAGAGIADQRWSDQRKQVLASSRLEPTRKLAQWILTCKQKPSVVIQGSAIGYYPFDLEKEFAETAEVADSFLGELSSSWENEIEPVTKAGIRTCLVRTSLVFGAGGGALGKMLPIFKLGLGGKLGSGKQWMSWIHIDDEVGGILHLLGNENCKGAYNFASPEPITNKDFTKALGSALGRFAPFPVPSIALKLLLGEMSCLLLQGQRVKATKLLESGFHFQYPSLNDAFSHIFKAK